MLNDLAVLERNLADAGIEVEAKHSDIKEMAKGAALRLRLDASGRLAEIDLIEEAGGGRVWTLRDSQHNGFPGLRTDGPLLATPPAELAAFEAAWKADKTGQSRRAALRALLAASAFNEAGATWPKPGHRRRIGERLELLKDLEADRKTAAVPAAFERFLQALTRNVSILEQLTEALAAALDSKGEDWLEAIRLAFTGQIALAIDVADDPAFARSAIDPRQVGPVSSALAKAGGGDGTIAEGSCAVSGETVALHSGNFPQPNLPGLGQTPLYARNKDIPSLSRYGRTSGAAFQIGSNLVQRLSGTADFLTEAERKGKTWEFVPAEAGSTPDLMIVSFGDPDADLARGLKQDEVDADEEDDDELDDAVGAGARLEHLGSLVLARAHDAVDGRESASEMTVLVLRSVDPGNRKAIYRKTSAPEHFAAATRDWSDARSNLPGWLKLPFPAKRKGKDAGGRLRWRSAARVAPLSLTVLTKILFAGGGQRRVDAVGASFADAYALFLDELPAAKVRSILRMLLARHGALYTSLGQARLKGTDAVGKFDPKVDLRSDCLRSIAFAGVCLHRLGRRKEVYMSDTAFRLGQLLNAADVLHIGYCADMRGGDTPPSLAGNSFLTMAAGNPTKAVAALALRMKPYLAWAKRERDLYAKMDRLRSGEGRDDREKKDRERRRWAIYDAISAQRNFNTAANALKGHLPEGSAGSRPDETFRAELLLGYLAGFEKPSRNAAQTSTDHEGDRS